MARRTAITASLGLALVLSACQSLGGGVDVVHKTGSTFAQRQGVIDACQVAALKDVPPAYETRIVGGYGGGFGPRYCAGWACYGYRGYAAPPTTVSFDPNDPLRARQFQRCLRNKGYTLISRPVCTTEQEANAYRNEKRQAPASSISCVAGEPRLQRRWVRTQ
ncbi:hypothetical protein [Roseibium sp. SCP14]|uniref:hypothetical protein n=1 Tax=Roseibium sp. SCP14 TaxID=3141375 RepID=UPI0033368E8D